MARTDISASDDFAARLSLALQVCNLSRAQFASTLGVNKSLVSRWLSGEMKPSGHNLARVSGLFAKLKPGFNMTLWNAPQSEFEAALGLPLAAQAIAAAAIGLGDSVDNSTDVSGLRRRSPRWAYAALTGAVVAALITSGLLAWRSTFRVNGTRPGPQVAALSTPSVAVLPFMNMSGDPAKEYLGDGIAEEILNDLSNTPELRVAARTSSFSFKDTHADIEEIARRLNVRAVLEGSIRPEGNRVRIVAQLIDARDGFHLWSASYDRRLDDILAVQDKIARAIVVALTRKLFPGQVGVAQHSAQASKRINPDAYEAYLQGLFSMNKSGVEDLLRAVDLFKRAIKLEPDFIDAHAHLAWAYVVLYFNAERRDTLGPAQAEIATVLKLDPDNFTTLLADAQVKQLLWRWNEADSAIRKLLREHPRNALAHHILAEFFEEIDLWDRAAVEHRRAAELDPSVPAYRDNVAQALHFVGRADEEFAELRQVLTLDPNFVLSLGNVCAYYADTGNLRDARKVLYSKLIPLYGDDPNRFLCASLIAYREHDTRTLQALARSMENLYARGALGASLVPYPYAFMGDYDNAMRWLQRAYDDHDSGIFYILTDPDLPKGMRANPRWQALMQRPAFQEIERVRAQVLAQPG